MIRRTSVKLLITATVFGAAFAMAASLGGITSADVGADDAVVASCDSDGVTTSYTSAWDATDSRYEISAVTVGGVSDTCDGSTVKVTLTDASGTQLGAGTLSIPTSAAVSHTVALSTAASAEDTEGIHVTIA